MEGGPISRFRRLESRLLASHILLAALPSVLLTGLAIFAVHYFNTMVNSPSVEQSFIRSTTLAHEVRDRLRVDAERLLQEIPAGLPPPEDEVWIRERLADRGFDFAIWKGSAGEFLVEVGESYLDSHPTDEDWEEWSRGKTPIVLRGEAMRFFGSGDRAVGVHLEPDVLNAARLAGDDYTRYRQLFRVEKLYTTGFRVALAAVLVITALVAFFVARTTARRISRPVTDLAAAADRLATGDLSHRAETGGEGEVGDLVTAFNRMGSQLERSREELVRMERLAAWRDVARRVAHEIRNPLTPIRLAVHRLQGRLPEDPGAQECLLSIGEEIENLTRISETFSEFARMPEPRMGSADLGRIVASVVELYGETVPGVRIETGGLDSLPLVGDRDLLRRAVSNLVKNAGEALRESGGHVRVTVQRRGNVGMVEVADDGPGVPEEIRSTLFRPGVSGHPGGSGLGLAMVQRIAMDHQGTLQWKPAEPGSVFTLELRTDLPEES